MTVTKGENLIRNEIRRPKIQFECLLSQAVNSRGVYREKRFIFLKKKTLICMWTFPLIIQNIDFNTDNGVLLIRSGIGEGDMKGGSNVVTFTAFFIKTLLEEMEKACLCWISVGLKTFLDTTQRDLTSQAFQLQRVLGNLLSKKHFEGMWFSLVLILTPAQ